MAKKRVKKSSSKTQPKRRKKTKSDRGGGSAPKRCRTSLRRCMVQGAAAGQPLPGKLTARNPGFAAVCMAEFNACRS